MNYTELWKEYGLPVDRDQPVHLFFVGAGFSMSLLDKISDLNGLTQKVKVFFTENGTLAKYEGEVLSKIRVKHRIGTFKIDSSHPNPNIEDILSHCYEEHKSGWILEISKAIFNILKKEQVGIPHQQVKEKIRETLMCTVGTKIVISFNYDTLLEDVLGWDGYGEIWRYAGIDRVCKNTNMVYLTPNETDHSKAFIKNTSGLGEIIIVKPHGSLNWVEYKEKNGRPVVVVGESVGEDFFYEDGSRQQKFKLNCFEDKTFLERYTLIVAPMPQKVPGPNITFHHFRLMLEALRRADLIVSLGWSCPISDNNLLEAIKFQFWERNEPLKQVLGYWKYAFDREQKSFKEVSTRFREMFPSLNYHFDEQGLMPSKFEEIRKAMNDAYSFRLQYPSVVG